MPGQARAVSAIQSDVDVDSSASGSFVNGKHRQALHACNECCKVFSKVDKQKIPLVLVSCGHTLCSQCVYLKLKGSTSGTVQCPLCKQVTKIIENGEVQTNLNVDSLTKLVPRNQALMNVMEDEDDFIDEVQVKVPPGHVVFGSKRNESRGPNKFNVMTPLTKLEHKQINNVSDSPFEDENNFTDQKADLIEICQQDSDKHDSSPVYSDNGGADSVRQSIIEMKQKSRLG